MNIKSVKSLYASKRCQYINQEMLLHNTIKSRYNSSTSVLFREVELPDRSKHYLHVYKHLPELFPEADKVTSSTSSWLSLS